MRKQWGGMRVVYGGADWEGEKLTLSEVLDLGTRWDETKLRPSCCWKFVATGLRRERTMIVLR